MRDSSRGDENDGCEEKEEKKSGDDSHLPKAVSHNSRAPQGSIDRKAQREEYQGHRRRYSKRESNREGVLNVNNAIMAPKIQKLRSKKAINHASMGKEILNRPIHISNKNVQNNASKKVEKKPRIPKKRPKNEKKGESKESIAYVRNSKESKYTGKGNGICLEDFDKVSPSFLSFSRETSKKQKNKCKKDGRLDISYLSPKKRRRVNPPSIPTKKKKNEKEKERKEKERKEKKAKEKRKGKKTSTFEKDEDDEVVFIKIDKTKVTKPPLRNRSKVKEKPKEKEPSPRKQIVANFCKNAISFDSKGNLRSRRETLHILCPKEKERYYNKVIRFHREIEKSEFSPFPHPFYLALCFFVTILGIAGRELRLENPKIPGSVEEAEKEWNVPGSPSPLTYDWFDRRGMRVSWAVAITKEGTPIVLFNGVPTRLFELFEPSKERKNPHIRWMGSEENCFILVYFVNNLMKNAPFLPFCFELWRYLESLDIKQKRMWKNL